MAVMDQFLELQLFWANAQGCVWPIFALDVLFWVKKQIPNTPPLCLKDMNKYWPKALKVKNGPLLARSSKQSKM